MRTANTPPKKTRRGFLLLETMMAAGVTGIAALSLCMGTEMITPATPMSSDSVSQGSRGKGEASGNATTIAETANKGVVYVSHGQTGRELVPAQHQDLMRGARSGFAW